jgi:hypothetical protein
VLALRAADRLTPSQRRSYGPVVSGAPDQRLPAVTDAESRFVEEYLAVADLLGRLNPQHAGDHAYRLVRSSQDLVAAAKRLRLAAEQMWQRGEREVFGEVLRQALVAQDGERRTRRVVVTAPADGGATP